jgi:hypothetical protein
VQDDRATKWLVRSLLALAGAYLVFLFWFAVRLQIRVEVEDPAGVSPAGTLLIGRSEQAVPLVPASGVTRNRLRIESAGGGEVQIHDVRSVHNGLVPLSSLSREGFELADDGARIASTSPGARLSWEGYTSDLVVSFRAGPAAGRARVEWNGVWREIDLRQATENLREVRLPSQRRLLLAQVSPWISRLRAQLTAPAGAVTASIVFGNELLLEERGTVGSDEIALRIPGSVRAEVLTRIAFDVATLFARVAFLWLLFTVAGWVVLAPAMSRLRPLERLAVPGIVGFSLVVVTTTSSIYITGAKIGLGVVLALLATLGVWLHRSRFRETGRLLLEAVRDHRSWRVEATAAVLFGCIFFFPAFLEGEWYLGHNFVDVYHYTNFGESFIHRPFHVVADHVWFSRFSDCVSLSVAALLLGEDTRSVFGVVALLVWLTMPFAASALLRRLNGTDASAKLGAILVGSAASLYTLFTQSYWAQYLFVMALVWSLALSAWCLQLPADATRAARWSAYAGVGAVFAFAISDYSFHFLVPIGWAVALLFYRQAPKDRWRELFALGGTTAALVNVNASVILLFGAMRRYYGDFKRVDEIAQWVVFPFADSLEFATIAYGVRDFVRNSIAHRDFVAEILALDVGRAAPAIDALRAGYFGVGWALTAAAVALSGMGLAACLDRRSLPRLLVACTTFAFVLYLGYLVITHELYGRAKLVMTFAAVLIPLTALGCARLWDIQRGRGLARIGVAAFALTFLGWNLITSTLESADSYVNRKSELLYRVRSHLTVVDLELKRVAALLEDRAAEAPSHVTSSCRLVDRSGSDGDRVMIARVDHLGIVGSRGRPLGPEATWEVRFNDVGCERPADVPPVMETPLFRVYPPRADGRGVHPWTPTPTLRRW